MIKFTFPYLKFILAALLILVFVLKLCADIVVIANKATYCATQSETKKANTNDADGADGDLDRDSNLSMVFKIVLQDWISPVLFATNAVYRVHLVQCYWLYIQNKGKEPFLSIETPPPDWCA